MNAAAEVKGAPRVVYVGQEFPAAIQKSIMLVGPTPRSPEVPSWRPEAIRILTEIGYDGVVFVPEGEHETWTTNYDTQVETEERMLRTADCIVCWVPRHIERMPAFTTNDEWGTWKYSGKVVFGAPPDTPKVRYQQYYAKKLGIPSFNTLEDTLRAAVARIGQGAMREGGERDISLYIWNTPSFKQWYKNLRAAGNRLDGARVEWAFLVGKNRSTIFAWAIHANVFVASENRNKINEIVIARPDISTVLAYRRRMTLLETEVVLIREFRSPVSNDKGFIYELPGGSSFVPGGNPRQLAADEFGEETGFKIEAARLKEHGSRQLMATFSAHRGHLFSVALTQAEIDRVRLDTGTPRGVHGGSKRTYAEVWRVGDLLDPKSGIDWSMLGMILSVLQEEF